MRINVSLSPACVYTHTPHTHTLPPPPPHTHTLQELCRVLFDALERVLAGTPSANLVNDLYQASTML